MGNQENSLKPISVNCLLCCHYSITICSRIGDKRLNWNSKLIKLKWTYYAFTTPLLKAPIQHSPYFLSWFTQYTNTQPSFSALVGNTGYASAFPGDSIPFTLSLQLLPTVLPMCLEDQDKHSHDDWLTEKESEKFELILAQLPQEEWLQKPQMHAGLAIIQAEFYGKTALKWAWASWRCHVVTTDPVLGWAHAPVCNLPVTGTVRAWSSDSCSQK